MGMTTEQLECAGIIAQAEQLIGRTQAMLQRAKQRSHGDIYEHLEVMAKRVYELRIRSEWLRLVVTGAIEVSPVPDLAERQPDRRNEIDRRVAGMRKQLLSVRD